MVDTAVQSTTARAMTVLGPKPIDELGVVMMHEHLLHDDVDEPCLLAPLPGQDGDRLLEAPLTIEILGKLWRWPLANRENVRLTREDGIADELLAFKAAGGGTVVETSTFGFAPDPEGLFQLSTATGVAIVAGCGYFVDATVPDRMREETVEELASRLIRALTLGFDGTSARAGIIGEVGVSPVPTEFEIRSLNASAIAAAETGAAISLHLSHTVAPGTTAQAQCPAGLDVIRLLKSVGAAPERVVCGHIDEAQDLDYAERLIDQGCVVGFDTFGQEWYWDNWKTWEPHDSARVSNVVSLCEKGLHESIVLSQDVAFKRQLHRFGGLGYDHLLVNIVPMLRDAGVTDGQLAAMLVDTPKRLLVCAT